MPSAWQKFKEQSNTMHLLFFDVKSTEAALNFSIHSRRRCLHTPGEALANTTTHHRKKKKKKSTTMMLNSLQTTTTTTVLLLLSAAATPQTAVVALSTTTQQPKPAITTKDRPLLRQFGKGINDRILNSKEGYNRFGCLEDNHYTSDETLPCLDMRVVTAAFDVSSQTEIREAYMANYGNTQHGTTPVHGRSSGSGCCIIRLTGKDAASVRGLVDFADNFFHGVDSDNNDDDGSGVNAQANMAARRLKDLGVFRIANNVHAGFDKNVNEEGKMQVLYTKLIPPTNEDDDPLLLPLEVGDLVGTNSLRRAHSGMSILFDIGSQITSAVLGMDSESTKKLLDDCSHTDTKHEMVPDNHEKIADTMSNSYQRIIRYLKPQPSSNNDQEEEEDAENNTAFWPHVDSTFLTLIPMPEIAGLEVWCPSSRYVESENLAERGEWVRPIKPSAATNNEGAAAAAGKDGEANSDEDCIHVVALAGEFLQLLSDGQVPTCIHRVIAPKPPPPSAFGFGTSNKQYIPRVSAPLFLRPRRGEEAVLDVESDLIYSGNTGLYFEEGLLEECDEMRVWDYMDCMSPDN